MRISSSRLAALIRESLSLLLEAAAGYYSNEDLNNKIDLVLGAEYTNIINHPDTPAGFDSLMKEIAIVESADIVDGKIKHRNEMDGAIKGVFQLSPIALKDLKNPKLLPSTKAYWFKKAKERGTQNPWEDQPDGDVYKYIMMQTVAACMYALRLYFWKGGDLSSRTGRSIFWADHYNSKKDPLGTSDYYINKLEKFGV